MDQGYGLLVNSSLFTSAGSLNIVSGKLFNSEVQAGDVFEGRRRIVTRDPTRAFHVLDFELLTLVYRVWLIVPVGKTVPCRLERPVEEQPLVSTLSLFSTTPTADLYAGLVA